MYPDESRPAEQPAAAGPRGEEACRDLALSLQRIERLAARALGVSFARVDIPDYRSAEGCGPTLVCERVLASAATLVTEGPEVIADTRQDPRTREITHIGIDRLRRLFAAVPVVLDDGTRAGTLWVGDDEAGTFDADRLGLLADFGAQAAETIGFARERGRSRAEVIELRDSCRSLQRTSQMAKLGVWTLDLQTADLYWSDEVFRVHEVPIGAPPSLDDAIRFYVPEDRPRIIDAVERAIEFGTPWDLELQMTTARERRIWVRAIGEPVREGGQILRLQGVFQDITGRKRAEQELRTAATHDGLTGLPNRSILLSRIRDCVNQADGDPGFHFAVLFIDFDRFKIINDSLGHKAGDDLLTQIASRLQVGTRTGDVVSNTRRTAGRLGGDEFVIVLEGLDQPGDATVVAERLLEQFQTPFHLGQHEVVTTASIGIVTSDRAAKTAEDILRDADTAMYEAKLAGKARYVRFDREMQTKARRRLTLEQQLRGALKRHAFGVVYEPIVCTESGSWVGFEALARWTQRDGTVVSPADFIPIAEETGLIIEIGEQMLEHACRDLVRWRTVSDGLASSVVNLNLSRSQLATADTVDRFAEIVEAHGLTPPNVRFEMSETQLFADRAGVVPLLERISERGFRIGIDDFGTGLSALSGLSQLPIDMLKIDRAFAETCTRRREVIALAKAVVDVSSALNIQTVGEGVETIDQLAELQAIDCPLAQGFLFSRGLTGDEVFEQVRANTHRTNAA